MKKRNDYRGFLKGLSDEKLLTTIKRWDEMLFAGYRDDFRYTSTPLLTKFNYAESIARQRKLLK